MTILDRVKKQRHYFANKGPYSQSYGFSSSLILIWVLEHKEDWIPKNWCFLIVVLEKILGSPLDSGEIKPVHPKGNQSWIFIRRTDAEAEAPILWPPDAKSWLIGKDSDDEKDWRQEEKVVTEDEMVWWHQWVNGHEFEQAPGNGKGQGNLACCSSWRHKNQTWLSKQQQQTMSKKDWYWLDNIHLVKQENAKKMAEGINNILLTDWVVTFSLC